MCGWTEDVRLDRDGSGVYDGQSTAPVATAQTRGVTGRPGGTKTIW